MNTPMAIPLYHEYAPSHPRFAGHYRLTVAMTWVPTLTAVILMQALDVRDLWFFGVLGLGLSLTGLLTQARRLDPADPGALPVTRNRLGDPDQWFPLTLVVIQGGVTILSALLLWFAITRYLFDVAPVYDTLVVILALCFPFRRYYAAMRMAGSQSGHGLLEELSLLVFSTTLVLLVCFAIQDSSGTGTSEDATLSVVVWVVSLILILFRVLLFLHRVRGGLSGDDDR